MSLADEKKLIKEIEQLKTSKKTAAQFMTQEEVRASTFDVFLLAVEEQVSSVSLSILRIFESPKRTRLVVLSWDIIRRERFVGGNYNQQKTTMQMRHCRR